MDLQKDLQKILAKRDELVAKQAAAAQLEWMHQFINDICDELDLIEAEQKLNESK